MFVAADGSLLQALAAVALAGRSSADVSTASADFATGALAFGLAFLVDERFAFGHAFEVAKVADFARAEAFSAGIRVGVEVSGRGSGVLLGFVANGARGRLYPSAFYDANDVGFWVLAGMASAAGDAFLDDGLSDDAYRHVWVWVL